MAVVVKKHRGGEPAPAHKAVKTRDRGTQTLKIPKQRPISATTPVPKAKREKTPTAAEASTTTKRPAGSVKQHVIQKRQRLDEKSPSPDKQPEMSFGSPQKRAKTTATATVKNGSERQAVDANQRKSPPKKASAA